MEARDGGVAMIVLFGTADDPILAAIAEALELRSVGHRVLDQRCAPPEFRPRICTQVSSTSESTIDGEPVRGVVLRPVAVADVAAAEGWAPDGPEIAAAALFASDFLAHCEFEPWTVINRLSTQASNLSKPWQLEHIRRWFDVPRTLVTTDASAAAAFHASCGRIIVKSVSAVRSIVREVQPDRDLAPVAHCPTLFQERIEGVDVRVHVVGRSVFATRMTSDADDYRYDTETRRESMAVPERIAHRCVQLSDSLGLLLAGCDFRVTPSGRWVCFEVNPSPAFTYFEPRPETPIAEAVAELLRDADSGPQGTQPGGWSYAARYGSTSKESSSRHTTSTVSADADRMADTMASRWSSSCLTSTAGPAEAGSQ